MAAGIFTKYYTKYLRNMSRSYIVTSQGTLERMPAPIQAEEGKMSASTMRIVVPESSRANILARQRGGGKQYVHNNTANSLNLRDYVEPKTFTREEAHVAAAPTTFNLKAYSRR